jgi:hypothetical protein
MKKEFVEEMKKMDFSPRFIRAAEQERFSDGTRLPYSCVNALFYPREDDKKRIGSIISFCYTWRYYDRREEKYKKTFRKYSGTELIHTAPKFEIYRECRKSETAFIIVVGNQIYSRFEYDDQMPLINRTQIDGNEVRFIGFPSKKETIVIVLINNIPAFFWGIPFLVLSAEDDEIIMACGIKAKTRLERIEENAPRLVFSL